MTKTSNLNNEDKGMIKILDSTCAFGVCVEIDNECREVILVREEEGESFYFEESIEDGWSITFKTEGQYISTPLDYRVRQIRFPTKFIRERVRKNILTVRETRAHGEKVYLDVKDSAIKFNYDSETIQRYKDLIEDHISKDEVALPEGLSYMMDIACNRIVRLYESSLPDSYEVLKELYMLIKKNKFDKDLFEMLILRGEIHPNITKKELINTINNRGQQ